MHVKINRTLATIALVLSIITLSGVLYGAFVAWSAMQDVQNALTEVGSTLGGTDTPAVSEVPELPSSGEVQGQEWWINEDGASCYIEPEAGETICEPAIPE